MICIDQFQDYYKLGDNMVVKIPYIVKLFKIFFILYYRAMLFERVTSHYHIYL
jgi:hypothetical protein